MATKTKLPQPERSVSKRERPTKRASVTIPRTVESHSTTRIRRRNREILRSFRRFN